MGSTEPGNPRPACPAPGEWAEEIAELHTVLQSSVFLRAPTLSKILEYVCQECAHGRGRELKEYNIAVSALGRGADFDPTSDSIVRVEFSRLRKRLLQYYATEGAASRIQIQLPEVGYIPKLVRQDPPAETPPAPPAPPPQTPPPARRLLAAGVLLAVGVGILLAFRWWPTHPVRRVSPTAGTSRVPGATTPVASALAEGLRISVGSLGQRYVDSSGLVWLADRYFTGGVVLSRPDRRIQRTLDPALYQKARVGDFQYDIPLKPGTYELHLYFAEIDHSDTLGSDVEGGRRFRIDANGAPLLQNFDIVLDAPGSDTADEKVFKDIVPASDGFLHLRLAGLTNRALLSGIEILPGTPKHILPIRILTGTRTQYDRDDQFWGADRYFSGGRTIVRIGPTESTESPELFASERFGSFSYFVPVADGRYSVTLRFAESNFGATNFGAPANYPGGEGRRIFDIYCNGLVLVKGLDIFKEAGAPNRAIQKTCHSLKPNAQGKLVFSFVPVVDYPTVRSIEVLDETE
ncbi:MAG: malectin domain-containing carbohydrate-binding protein [Ignavibacteriota bacterium]